MITYVCNQSVIHFCSLITNVKIYHRKDGGTLTQPVPSQRTAAPPPPLPPRQSIIRTQSTYNDEEEGQEEGVRMLSLSSDSDMKLILYPSGVNVS